ncbi:MAG: hypothetical protein IPK79_11410 [Vampirovibrionales bacterium]|nr:hypothetical protein [Vampirovibrionales bacterium]
MGMMPPPMTGYPSTSPSFPSNQAPAQFYPTGAGSYPSGTAGLDSTRFGAGDAPPRAGQPRFGCLGGGIGEIIAGCCGCCAIPIALIAGGVSWAMWKMGRKA